MKNNRLFITGIPAAGKSYLAKLIADKVGGVAVSLDDLRGQLFKDEKYRKWINFYLDKDEKQYMEQTTPEDKWKNLVAQSEGLWPGFLEEIKRHSGEERPVIFECVNILPHLAKRDLNFPGIVVVGSSQEEILERILIRPRWGSTPELKQLEAKAFFQEERPNYTSEAEKYGYPVFGKADDAVEAALELLR